MIGFDVLLVPDTGEQFARCLRTAALYSEKIFCVSSAAPRVVRDLLSQDEPGDLTKRYLTAAESHEKDFALLKAQGILGVMDDPLDASEPSDELVEGILTQILVTCVVRYQIAKRLVRAGKVSASFLEEMGRNKAMRSSPPAAWHALLDVALKALAENNDASFKKLLTPQIIERSVYEMYAKMLTEVADASGVSIVTYSSIVEQSLSEVRRYPSSSFLGRPEEYVKVQVEEYRRRAAGNRLAHRLLIQHLPRADDLRLEDVLEIRRKSKDQIDAFRVGLGEMAAQIDTSKAPEQDGAQFEQLIRTKIGPAVADLKASIQNSKLDMFKTLYGPKETAAAATVSVGVSYMTHASATGNLAASLITVLFPAISALVAGHLERKRLINANRWSLLIGLEDRH